MTMGISRKRKVLLAGLSLALLAGGMTVAVTGAAADDASEPSVTGGTPAFRRMNESQYVHTIQDIFGKDINVPGRFEPALRKDGLMAIGDANVVVTPSGFEQYELRAREISAQVLSDKKRAAYLTCTPKSATVFDEGCATQFLTKYGRLLLRRPLAQSEHASVLATARQMTQVSGNFYTGIEAGLARLMVSPFFIFRVETAEPAPGGGMQLNSFSFASRLSFLLWDAPPDEMLLDAAARGDLNQQAGLSAQIDRMMASPKFEQGMRAYFWDMFGYDQFDGLSKEQTIFPKYVSQLAKDAQEQSMRTIIAQLVTNNGDYRDLFTTRQTFINRNLASLYRIAVEPDGIKGWMPYTFQPEDQRQGLLSFAGFLMLDPSHEGRSSPTNRGKFVREGLLCQKVPAPPANVNFAIVQDATNAAYATARDRLKVHQENPVCAGCHALTDPLGLAMENFDAVGQFRTHENGALIDTSGKLAGKPFKDLASLQTLLHDDPALTSCLVQRVSEYGVGRSMSDADGPWLEYVNARFAVDGYRLPALLRALGTSKAFRAISSGKMALSLPNSTRSGDVHGVVTTQRP